MKRGIKRELTGADFPMDAWKGGKNEVCEWRSVEADSICAGGKSREGVEGLREKRRVLSVARFVPLYLPSDRAGGRHRECPG